MVRRYRVGFVLWCAGHGLACGTTDEGGWLHHPAFTDIEFPMVIGHGGASGVCPRNTMPCYQRALDAGAAGLEADVQLLGDGTLVMFHDFDASAHGVDKALIDMDLREFREIDAGYAHSPDDGATFPYRGTGLIAPTLAELIEEMPGVPVLLDVKVRDPEIGPPLVDFVARRFDAAAYASIYIKVNNQGVTDSLRALEPTPRVAFSAVERFSLLVDPRSVEDLPPSWIDLEPEVIDGSGFDLADWADAHHHVFTASTVDEVAEGARMLDYPVAGLVTNFPDVMVALIDQRP